MKPHQDPNHPFNGEEYHTGRKCATSGCNNPAGTKWSHLWCFECNRRRMDRISKSLEGAVNADTSKAHR